MGLFDIVTVLLVLMAGFAFLNERYFRLPIMLGLALMALLWSVLWLLNAWWFQQATILPVPAWIHGHLLYQPLISSLLGLLLFAGGLRMNLADLANQLGLVLVLVILAVASSVLLVGSLGWLILSTLGVSVVLAQGWLFGALIAPTDPVLVRGLLIRAGVNPALRDQMIGESVLGAGVALVVFSILLAMMQAGEAKLPVAGLLWQVGGGLLLGLASGFVAYRLLRLIDHYQVEVLILLALVAAIMALASYWQFSMPLALLAAGLLLGNHGRLLAMSEKTRRHLHDFWELVGGVVNAVLVVLLAMALLSSDLRVEYFLSALAIVPVILLGRLFATGIPLTVLRRFRIVAAGTVQFMTWGGLRGGISMALVLSLPHGEARDALIVVTAVMILFSLVVQGVTFRPLVRHQGE